MSPEMNAVDLLFAQQVHPSWAGGLLLLAAATAMITLIVALVVAVFRKGAGGIIAAVGVLLLTVCAGLVIFCLVAVGSYRMAAEEPKFYPQAAWEAGELDVSYPTQIELALGPAAEVNAESFDASEAEAEEAEIKKVDEGSASPKLIERAEINLSGLPENYPNWIDQTEGVWDSEEKKWSTRVMIGPYETEKECELSFEKEVQKAVTQYAKWYASRADNADSTLFGYDRLPGADLRLRNYEKEEEENDKYELRTYRRGHVRETYHTKYPTEVAEEPWPVVFARVEFDSGFQRKIESQVRHGLSLRRALQAGSVWGLGFLGLVAVLGGLKLVQPNDSKRVRVPQPDPMEPQPAKASLGFADNSTQIGSRLREKFNPALLTAPIICTIIYLLCTPGHYFWPKWVWFGCVLVPLVSLSTKDRDPANQQP